jgi:hypothetical protein
MSTTLYADIKMSLIEVVDVNVAAAEESDL